MTTSVLPALQSPKFDGSQRDHVEALIHDFRREHEQHMKNIQMEAEKQKQKQKQLHATEMVRIPKNIKQMTVDDFNTYFQCDLLQMIREVDGMTSTSTTTTTTATTMLPAGLQTPSFKSKMKMETPSRTIRRGEGIYSSNGSPLEKEPEENILLTVTKKKRRAVTGGEEEDDEDDLNIVVGGVPTSLTSENIQHMPECVQSEAYTNLKKMHENIGKLLQQFEQKSA